MLTRIAPMRAVANWTTTHSSVVRRPNPHPIALRHPLGEKCPCAPFHLQVELFVAPPDPLMSRDEGIPRAVLVHRRAPRVADRRASKRHVGEPMRICQAHCSWFYHLPRGRGVSRAA